MNLKMWLFIFFLFYKTIGIANAAPFIILNPGQERTDIDARTLDIFEDQKGKLTVSDIDKPEMLKNFKKSPKKVLSFGFTEAAIWVKLLVKNNSSVNKWILSINFPDLDDLIFYKKNEKGAWEKSYGGDIYSSSKWDYLYKDYVFNLGDKKEETYYLRIKSRGAITVPLQMMSQNSFKTLRGKNRYFFGGYFAILLFMGIYNLIIALFLKSKSFLAYVGYLFSLGWMTLVLSGVGRSVLVDSIWFSNEGFVLSLIIFFFFFLLFTKEFVGVEKKDEKLNKVYKYSFYSIGVFGLIFPFVNLKFNLNLIAGSAVPAIGTGLFTGFYFFKEKRQARFYVYSFLIACTGGILKALSALGIFPSTFLIENGIFLALLIQVTVLGLGLADVINTLLFKTIEAEGQLMEANRTLEEKVKFRTRDLSLALNDISNLLNNMRQAVFTIDKTVMIMDPVSLFSKEMFHSEIVGKNVFDLLYKDLDEKSEAYSTLQFSLSVLFGTDDLQWEMMKDFFPQKVNYTILLDYPSHDNKELTKILRIATNPLWNEEGMLEKIMFVVEDITELEKLEEEMKEQKESSLKNLEILQELAVNKKEDLIPFFSGVSRQASDSLILAKKIREEKNIDSSKESFLELFRVLHSLKGNSRVFGLSQISKEVHDIETGLSLVHSKENKLIFDRVDPVVQSIYGLQGIINKYIKSSKEIFSFEFSDDLKLKEHLFSLTKDLEGKVSQLMIRKDFFKNDMLEDEKVSYFNHEIKENQNFDKIVKELKHICHNLKGLSRSMDESDISGDTHLLESGITSIVQAHYDKDEILNISSINTFIKDPLINIRENVFNIFCFSSLFQKQSFEKTEFSSIFQCAYHITKFSLDRKVFDDSFIFNRIYGITTKCKSEGLYYLGTIFDEIYFYHQEPEKGDSQSLNFYIKKIWEFLGLVSYFEFNKNVKEETLKEFKNNILKYSSEIKLNKELMTTSFFSFLRECDKEGDSTEDVFEVIKQCLDLSVEETVSFFIPNTTFSQDVKGLFFELRRTFSVETLNNLKSVLNEDSIIPIIEKLTTALEYDDFTWIHLMFKVDLLKVIQTFSQVHSIEEAESNPDVNEILDFNLSLCQKALRKTFKATKNCEGAIFEAFEYLLELPIKHSLKRFKGLVEDISESLGKKIDFVIQGDQGSLNKEKIDLLFESMVHLIRNAIDHGIEGPEKRVKKGKKKVGKIFINCSYLDAKTFRISLEDDGKGIDTQALLDKAIERGQIEKDKNVKFSEEEKLNLIFLPNLSTKKEVSEISGRGVGMDVVKTNLQKMNSKLSIETKSGAGTKFTIDIDISKKFLEF